MATRPTLVGVGFSGEANTTTGAWAAVQHTDTQVGDLLVLVSYTALESGTIDGYSLNDAAWTVLTATYQESNSKLLLVAMRPAVSAGVVAHNFNMAYTTSDDFKDRRNALWAFRGHRPIGTDGGPIANIEYISDTADTSEMDRSVAASGFAPGTTDTLLCMSAYGYVQSGDEQSGSMAVTPPSGMTTYSIHPYQNNQQITGGAFYQLLTGSGATGGKTALVRQRGASVSWRSDAGVLFAVRAPNSAPTQPGVFTLPTAGQALSGTHTIAWGASTDADGDTITYRLEYAADGTTFVPVTTTTATSASVNMANLAAGTSAKFRVRAEDPWAQSAWRESSAFTNNAAPTAPTIVIPSAGSTVSAATPVTFDWTHNDTNPGDNQTQYRLRRKRMP